MSVIIFIIPKQRTAHFFTNTVRTEFYPAKVIAQRESKHCQNTVTVREFKASQGLQSLKERDTTQYQAARELCLFGQPGW
jgi:hypothetical protein